MAVFKRVNIVLAPIAFWIFSLFLLNIVAAQFFPGGFSSNARVAVTEIYVPSTESRDAVIVRLCSELVCEGFRCQCDDDCNYYGDCCYGFNPGKGSTVKTERGNPDLQCVAVGLEIDFDYGTTYDVERYSSYLMIQSCPATPGPLTEAQLQVELLCASAEIPDFSVQPDIDEGLLNFLPVRDNTTGLHYRNVYCAWCHGVEVSEMIPYDFEKSCVFLSHITSSGTESEYLCSSFRFEPPSGLDAPRPCEFSPVIDQCPDGYADSDPEIAQLCQNYTAALTINERRFHNPHCAFCYGYLDNDFTYCPDHLNLGNDNPFLVIPFQFLPIAQKALPTRSRKCPTGYEYSESATHCVTQNVQPVTIQDACLINDTLTYFNLTVTIHLIRGNSTDNDLLDIVQTTLDNALNLSDENYDFQVDRIVVDDIERVSLEFTAYNSTILVNSTNEKINQIIYELRNILNEFGNLTDVILKYPCSQYHNRTCSSQSYVGTNNASFVRSSNSDVLLRIITSHGEVYLESENVFVGNYFSSVNGGNFTTRHELILCHRLACAQDTVILDKSAFSISNGSGKHVLIANGQRYYGSDFLLLPDDRALVCPLANFWSSFSPALGYINLVFSIASLVALVLTFLTYCALQKLRTLPGKATMNFVVALFGSQLVLLLGGSQTSNPAVCTFIAIIAHYLWLATFCWMSVLAFDVSRTFGTRTVLPKQDGSYKWLVLYMIICWVVPVIPVGICLGLHFTPTVEFYYGGSVSCWIRPEFANLGAFGAPVLVLLILNVALFVKTVIGVHRSKKDTKRVESHKSTQTRVREELLISIKVCTLIGLTWIWGFIAAFSQATVCWYIYIILNSLQGVFIFVFFVCNQRVWKMFQTSVRRTGMKPTASRSTQETYQLGSKSQSLETLK